MVPRPRQNWLQHWLQNCRSVAMLAQAASTQARYWHRFPGPRRRPTMEGSDSDSWPVTVLQLKFQILGGHEETCWCGTRKPFGNLFRHLIDVLKLPGAEFYYGGTKKDPTMGVVVPYDSCPDDLMISNLERIDIVPKTRPLRPPPLASAASIPQSSPNLGPKDGTAASAAGISYGERPPPLASATGSSASSAVPQRRMRTPSRSPRRTLARGIAKSSTGSSTGGWHHRSARYGE
jgi:hypothetical protein